jgi:hypothetical protein
MLSRRLRSSPVARAASLGVVVAILVALPGCSTIRSMMPEAREAKRIQLGVQQLQAKCMRYADVYVGRVVVEAVSFERSVTNPEVRAMVNRYLAVRMKT